MRRTKRGGWPYSQPPNTQFEINRASPQSVGLIAWWPTLGSRGANFLRELVRGTDMDNVAGSPEWSTDRTVGAALKFTRADTDALFTTKTLGFDYDNMTYSLWMYPTQGAGNRMTMLSPNNIAGAVSFETDDALGNQGRLSLVRPGLFVARTNQGVMSTNSWYHVVYSKWGVNAGEQAIYINGVSQVLAVDAGDNLGSTATIWRLGERTAASQNFEGFLADIRICNRAFTSTEVWQLYNRETRWELYKPLIRRFLGWSPPAPTTTTTTLAPTTSSTTTLAPTTSSTSTLLPTTSSTTTLAPTTTSTSTLAPTTSSTTTLAPTTTSTSTLLPTTSSTTTLAPTTSSTTTLAPTTTSTSTLPPTTTSTSTLPPTTTSTSTLPPTTTSTSTLLPTTSSTTTLAPTTSSTTTLVPTTTSTSTLPPTTTSTSTLAPTTTSTSTLLPTTTSTSTLAPTTTSTSTLLPTTSSTTTLAPTTTSTSTLLPTTSSTTTLAPTTSSTTTLAPTTSSTTTLAPTTTSTSTLAPTSSTTTTVAPETTTSTSTSTLSTTSTTTLLPCDVVVAVTQVACDTGIGDQDITTVDLGGRTPKAAFFIVTHAQSNGVAADYAVLGIGAATGASNRWACGVSSEHGQADTDTHNRATTDECVLKLFRDGSGVEGEADFVSFIANGVRINWGDAPNNAYLLTVVLFAGNDLSAHASTFALGNQDAATDVNTVGFEPDAILAATNCEDFDDVGRVNGTISHGIALNLDPVEQYCWAFRSEDAQPAGAPSARITDDYGIGQVDTAGAWDWAGDFSTFDVNGFSCTPRLGNSGDTVGFLALAFNGKVQVAGGIISTPIANGNQSIVDPGFIPQYVHVGLTQMLAIDTSYANNYAGSIGISTFDEDDEYSNSIQDEDGADPTDTQSLVDNVAVNIDEDDGTAGHIASFVGFDANGWTWNFTQTLGTAVQWWYLAIEVCGEAATTTTTTTLQPTTTSSTTTLAPETTTSTSTLPPTTTSSTTTLAPTTTSTLSTTTVSTTSTSTLLPDTTTTLRPAPTTPTHEESLSLTLNVFTPDFSTGTYVPRGTYVASLQQEVNSYSHEIKAFGGYWSSKFTILDKQEDMEGWLTDGLGRHIEVYDNALVKIWEGFVNQVDLTLGGLTATRGPLLDVANRVSVVYSGTSTETDPPVAGNRVRTAPVNDLESQGQYGIIEQILSAGGMMLIDAEQARDTYMAENSEPKTIQKLGSGGGLNVSISCLGYVHWFNYLISLIGVEGTVNLNTKLGQVLDADSNGLFASSNSDLMSNTLQVPAYDNKSRTAWDVAKELVALGDETDTRYIFGVYADRHVTYQPTNQDEIAYRYFPGDPARRIESSTGGNVWPWNVLPGRWMFFPSFLIGRTFPDDWRQDPRFMFIESVVFRLPHTLQLQGGRLDTIPQKLAKMGLAGIGA